MSKIHPNEIIEKIEDIEAQCVSCKKQATVSNIEVRDVKPYKFISYTKCFNCGYQDFVEEDIESLEYGIEIECEFNSKEDLRRLIFTNHDSKKELFYNGQELCALKETRCNIRCIEGELMEIQKVLSTSFDQSEEMMKICAKIDDFINGEPFRMRITDNTGYSRVCPLNVEYTEVVDWEIEKLNQSNTNVIHTKVPKVEPEQ